MVEYIKRKEAILTVKGYAKHAIDKGRKCLDAEDDTIHMCDEIDRLLAVDVIPRPRWVWTDIWEYGRYDEEHDDYFVPEGWWESRCFTPDDVYNCMVDCEVTHWMPMPELPEEKTNGNK